MWQDATPNPERMSQADKRLPERIRTLAEGLATAADVAASDPDARASVRRMALALAGAAESEGLDELAARARKLHDADDRALTASARELIAYCTSLGDSAPEDARHVLVVDDDPVTLNIIEAALALPSRVIHTAPSAEGARRLLHEHAMDLVVLDLHLPDADGRDVLVELRQTDATRTTPVVVLSGEEGEVAPAECYALGADAFVSKPPDLRLLRSTVTRQLGRREVRQTPPTAAARKILVVEDDDVVAALIEHRLGKAGFAVVRFDDGRDGFEAVQDASFDLVLLDVKLPGMDGFDFLRRLREIPHLHALPVIILSALDDEDAVVRGLSLGADDYVPKPFSPAELMARIRRLIEA